jgi:hypothetical protein
MNHHLLNDWTRLKIIYPFPFSACSSEGEIRQGLDWGTDRVGRSLAQAEEDTGLCPLVVPRPRFTSAKVSYCQMTSIRVGLGVQKPNRHIRWIEPWPPSLIPEIIVQFSGQV